ncbi:MAG: porin [Bacteroidota bacterium]
MKKIVYCLLFLISGYTAYAQSTKPVLNAFVKKGRGIGVVTADSIFSVNFQFRMQNRAAFVSKSNGLAPESFEFRVRRLRLKFEGFVYDPRITYYFQLSFSRGDMDWRLTDSSKNNHSPNIVRDAVIYYSLTNNLKLGFGQTKLPGNRQRVVSSGDLQFADRSIVNATFNIDRDFGFFAHYTGNWVNLRGAITSGEGRNSVSSNNKLAYTGRLEFLPLGKFTGKNDYIEGDLEREPTPKISIASTYSINDDAVRQSGQLGNDLYEPRVIRNFEADVLVKYNGWAWYNEYMQRNASNPVTSNGSSSSVRYIYVGSGYLSQLSYLFKNNVEVAARYSTTVPFKAIYNDPAFPSVAEKKLEQIELGITRYLVGHRLKVQGNLLYGKRTNLLTDSYDSDFWSAIFQVELGI